MLAKQVYEAVSDCSRCLIQVIKCSGHMMAVEMEAPQGSSSKMRYMAVVCEHIPHPSNIEVPMDGQTFLTRHNLDMTFTYCDDR